MANYVKGIPQTREALRALKDIVNKPMAAAGRAALQPALDEAKASVPRDEGHLQSSLAVVQVPTGDRLHVKLLLGPSGRTKAEHAHLAQVASLLEFGRQPNPKTGKGGFPPKAWLRQVYERHKEAIINRYITALEPEIKRRIAQLNKGK